MDIRIAKLPPAPTTMPLRPFTLDAAINYISMPDLGQFYTKTKEQKSTFSRLFGWS